MPRKIDRGSSECSSSDDRGWREDYQTVMGADDIAIVAAVGGRNRRRRLSVSPPADCTLKNRVYHAEFESLL